MSETSNRLPYEGDARHWNYNTYGDVTEPTVEERRSAYEVTAAGCSSLACAYFRSESRQLVEDAEFLLDLESGTGPEATA